MKLLRLTLLGLACTLPAVGFAQWQWIDNNGRKVFSDQSPPANIPAKNILRQPGVTGTPVAAAAAAAAEPAKVQASAPKITGKDKQLEEKKKQAEASEAEKKKAEEEQQVAEPAGLEEARIDRRLWERCGMAVLCLYLGVCAATGGVYRPRGVAWNSPATAARVRAKNSVSKSPLPTRR